MTLIHFIRGFFLFGFLIAAQSTVNCASTEVNLIPYTSASFQSASQSETVSEFNNSVSSQQGSSDDFPSFGFEPVHGLEPITELSDQDETDDSNATPSHGNRLQSNPYAGILSSRVLKCDKTMAIVEYADNMAVHRCELFDLEKRSQEAAIAVIRLALPVEKIEFHELHKIINQCQQAERFFLQNQRPSIQAEDSGATNGSSSESLAGFWRGVIPGTKWCGLGDIAKNYHDIGRIWTVDICCRTHDHCPSRLKGFRYGYGLFNLSFYTRSHCSCDEAFRRCLQKSNSGLSSALGNIYFNVVQVYCFGEECGEVSGSSSPSSCENDPNRSKRMTFRAQKPFP